MKIIAGEEVRYESLNRIQKAEAVSYTHLDVYKRQLENCPTVGAILENNPVALENLKG